MRLGKISAILLGIAGATFLALMVLRPGWGNPLRALGGLLIIFSFLSALIVGIVGIICDKRKILAIITTIIAGGFVLFYLSMMAMSIMIMLCRWARHQIRTARSTQADTAGSSDNRLVLSTGKPEKALPENNFTP